MNRKFLFGTCIFVLLLSACSTKTWISSNDGQLHDIYVDGEYICNGSCYYYGNRGVSKRVIVEAKDGNQILGQASMSRSITAASVVFGFFTYFTSLYWYEAYPDEIKIPINSSASLRKKAYKNSWDAPYKNSEDPETATSQWDQPFR
ncbi:MAG: hypothetical protein M0P13_11820 [Fibrobacteraceae bacterium]|nr:hypothetical protein [Fibrobacteraceae bacterium]